MKTVIWHGLFKHFTMTVLFFMLVSHRSARILLPRNSQTTGCAQPFLVVHHWHWQSQERLLFQFSARANALQVGRAIAPYIPSQERKLGYAPAA